MHNEKIGRSVNIVNMFLKCAFEHCSELHSDDSAAGQQRAWDGMIDMINKWTRKWGSCFPTFLVRQATPRHAPPRHVPPRHATTPLPQRAQPN